MQHLYITGYYNFLFNNFLTEPVEIWELFGELETVFTPRKLIPITKQTLLWSS